MADALCGPSNPLQSFQKHTEADRTLLQDRISGPRHSPAQGFRSRDPRTGSLDAEFAAFEAGPASPFQLEQPLVHGSLPAYQPPASRQNGVAPSWAADFQNLHISNQPIPSHQFRTEAPLMRSNGWHSEFATHQSNGGSVIAQGKQAAQPSSQNQYVAPNWRSGQYSFGDGYMGVAPVPYSFGQQQQIQGLQQSQQQAEPMYDEAGFAEAFEQASHHAHEMVKDRPEVDQTQEINGSDLLHKDAIPMDHSSEVGHDLPSLMRSPSPTHIRIGSDAIPYQDQKPQTPDQNTRDADELARTAGQLLNSVQHDTSDKFQNSQFLALMRRIRDREVRVEGEEFKETHGSDTMVSNFSVSVMHRAEIEYNMLARRVPINLVVGPQNVEVALPSHSLDGQILDYSNPQHRRLVAKLLKAAVKFVSSGNYVIEYAPGSFVSGGSSRLDDLEPSTQKSLLGHREAGIQALKDAARALKPRKRATRIPTPLSILDDRRETDDPRNQDPMLTDHYDEQNGLEDPHQARTQTEGQTDAHQLHPGGPFYPEQSPPLKRATMSGGLGITADDLDHFDQLEESPGLSSRYQRPNFEDHSGGASA